MQLGTAQSLRFFSVFLLGLAAYGIYSWQMKKPRVIERALEKIVEKPVEEVVEKTVEKPVTAFIRVIEQTLPKKQPVKKPQAPRIPEKSQPARATTLSRGSSPGDKMPQRHPGYLNNGVYKVRSPRFDSAVANGYTIVELITVSDECTFLHFTHVATSTAPWTTTEVFPPWKTMYVGGGPSYLVDDQGERYSIQPSGDSWGRRALGLGEVFRHTACYERLRGNPRDFMLTYHGGHKRGGPVKIEIKEPLRAGERPLRTYIPVVIRDRSELPRTRRVLRPAKAKPSRGSQTKAFISPVNPLKPRTKALDCNQALRKYRQNQATSETVRAACPADVAALATSEEQ